MKPCLIPGPDGMVSISPNAGSKAKNVNIVRGSVFKLDSELNIKWMHSGNAIGAHLSRQYHEQI